MRGADRLSPDGIDRRAALRSQRRHRGGGEPARPVRHGHAERNGAAVDEGRGLDQRDDHEHHANRHRRDRAGVCLAGAALRARRCRGRGGLRCGPRAVWRAVCDHARLSGRNGGRYLGLRGDRRVGSPAPARHHVRDLRLGARGRSRRTEAPAPAGNGAVPPPSSSQRLPVPTGHSTAASGSSSGKGPKVARTFSLCRPPSTASSSS